VSVREVSIQTSAECAVSKIENFDSGTLTGTVLFDNLIAATSGLNLHLTQLDVQVLKGQPIFLTSDGAGTFSLVLWDSAVPPAESDP